MKLGETNLARIRIPIVLEDDDGVPIVGLVAAAHELQTSVNGAAWGDAAGTLVAVGSGVYYYQGVVPDAASEGFIAARINRSGVHGVGYRSVDGPSGIIILPITIRDDDGPAAGCNPSGAGELQMSIDGGAFVAATGTFGEIGGGEYYYRHNVPHLAGLVIVKVNKAGFHPAFGWGALSNVVATAPAITNISPAANAVPGSPGSFSATFATARNTPLEFDLSGLPAGASVAISVKFEARDETYQVLSFDASWLWPFDIEPDNAIGELAAEPVHVKLLPRGGWPPGKFVFQAAAAAKAAA